MNNHQEQQDFKREESMLTEYGRLFKMDEDRIQLRTQSLLNKLNHTGSHESLVKKLVAAFIAFAVLLFSGVGTVSASYASLPGDALFPIREYLEQRAIDQEDSQSAKSLLQLQQLEKKIEQAEMRGKVEDDKTLAYFDTQAASIQEGALDNEELLNQLELFLNEDDFMNKKSLLAAVIGLAMVVQPAFAQDTLDDIDPGVLPNSPFYVIDLLTEKIELLLTLNPEKKIEKRLEFALEKLAEARAMSEAGEEESADEALDEYDSYVEDATDDAEDADEDEQEDLSARVAEATYQHLLILEDLLDRVPEQARKGIENAIEKSQNGNRHAIDSLSRKNKIKGAAMAVKQAEKRLERLKELAEENEDVDADDVESESEDVEDEVELAESIGDEAEEEDADEVDDAVKEVHRKHIEVLQEVYEKVPEQAQKGIERALENAERNEERFLEKVKDREARKEMRQEMKEQREYEDESSMERERDRDREHQEDEREDD